MQWVSEYHRMMWRLSLFLVCLTFAPVAAVGDELALQCHAFFYPATEDRGDEILLKIRKTNEGVLNHFQPPQDYLWPLFQVEGYPASWKKRAHKAPDDGGQFKGSITELEKDDVLTMKLPLEAFFTDYQIDSEIPIVMGVPILLHKEGGIASLVVKLPVRLYPMPDHWTQHPEPKRVVHAFFEMLEDKEQLDNVRIQLLGYQDPEADVHESTKEYLSGLHAAIASKQVSHSIRGEKRLGNLAVVAVGLTSDQQSKTIGFYLIRSDDHWRLIPQTTPLDESLQKQYQEALVEMEVWLETQ